MTTFLENVKHILVILGPFCPIFGKKVSLKNQALSIFKFHSYLPLC